MKRLIDYSDNPAQALEALARMSEGNPQLQRIWRANLKRIKRREARA